MILEIVALLGAFFMAITIHEFSHALVSYLLGDETAKNAGRLTLNPVSHLDPFGLLFLFVFGIGWAKPVPMNMYNFAYPRFYAVLSALAGPLSNFILALVCMYLFKYIPLEFLGTNVASFITLFLKSSIQLNIMLGIFNLLPIPPLDGSHIINIFIPEGWRDKYYRLMPLFIIGLLILLSLKPMQNFLMNAMNAAIKFLSYLVI